MLFNHWHKKGQIFSPKGDHPLLLTHASNPLPVYLHDDVFRVFYSGRDCNNKSSVGFVDIDIVKQTIVHSQAEPVFVYGDESSFFSHGVSIGNVYCVGEKRYILFMGWQIPEGGHWRGDIGRIELNQEMQLFLNPKQAYLSVDDEDEISLSYPCVIQYNGLYHMWYGSTIDWHTENGEMLHVIKYATSIDGEQWEKHGQVIESKLGVAQAFSRPTVIVVDGVFHMWYSYRSGNGTKYRIGYSKSKDGKLWENYLHDNGIDVSKNGWDSEMVCYPYVLEHNGVYYMLYNGNDFGKFGFGLASFNL